MSNLKHMLGGSLSERAIEELTCVKTALQEKNEQLDERDDRIRQLTGRIRELEADLQDAETTMSKMAERVKQQEIQLKQEGCMPLIEELVHLLSRYEERSPSAGRRAAAGTEEAGRDDGARYGGIPGEKLLTLLEGYGVEVIQGPVGAVDPNIHHVVEVAEGSPYENREERVVPLARGYRIGERVIRPLQLQVLRGGGANESAGDTESDQEEPAVVSRESRNHRDRSRLVLVQNTRPQEGPRGAA
jgi:molecular chaperone GrpE (heat shock protein)